MLEGSSGFTVIASEIRQLADSVVTSVGEIREAVEGLSAATEAIKRATSDQEVSISEGAQQLEQAVGIIGRIEAQARAAAEAAVQISEGTRQQQAGATEAVSAMHETARMAQTLSDASLQSEQAATELRTLTDRMNSAIRAFRLS